MAVSSRKLTNLCGMVLSILCVIHCMLMPICLASLPSWGLDWLVGPRVHQSLALLGVAIGLATLVPGWRTHRRSSVLVLATVGLLVMNYAAFSGDDCCVAPSEDAISESRSSCCEQSCCVEQQTQADSLGDSSVASLFLPTVWISSISQWLWKHPTAFGAALLACAHCLNGCCCQKRCRNRSETTIQVQPMMQPHDDGLAQLETRP